MMCYRDKTFCEDKECSHFKEECDTALTEKVRQDAYKWWGSEKAPIATYTSRLDCFEEKIV